MSQWTDNWRDFVRETSYKRHLKDEALSNDQFWRSFEVYDLVLQHSGYPGKILQRISSFIPPGSTLLDIGAGTGAFAIPLSGKTKRTIAIDPSHYHLEILSEKAAREGLTNMTLIEKEWSAVSPSEVSGVDYSLAAYSLFDEDIERFLQKMLDVSKKGIFIVFRAEDESADTLSDFAYGKRTSADYSCLCHILKDMGHNFKVMLFKREYLLPLDLVYKQFRFCRREPKELADYLQAAGRLQEKGDKTWAKFSARDALLYMIR